jgi:hypothetical protein
VILRFDLRVRSEQTGAGRQAAGRHPGTVDVSQQRPVDAGVLRARYGVSMIGVA